MHQPGPVFVGCTDRPAWRYPTWPPYFRSASRMLAEERIVTPTLLLTKVGDTGWEIAEGESGVSFAEFASV